MEELIKVITILELMRDDFDMHTSRVAEFAVRFAKVLGLPDFETIGDGANLHDIGKLRIDKDILNLPRELNKEERAEVEKHSFLGWELVERAGLHPTVLAIVRWHHERWNGTGYPDGLSGQGIPIAARIGQICDVYDALINKRAYRGPFTPAYAKAYMQSRKGIDFDGELVDIFFKDVIPTEEIGAVDK